MLILLFGAFFRIASEEDGDGNVIMFAMILGVGVIYALSLVNVFVIDLFNDLNERWTILNYCVPAVVVFLMIWGFRIPIETIDLFLLPVLILIADLCMYAMVEEPKRTHSS
ncbi:MAG TPA: hypothetical protein VK589_20770 [Chryseolinea sp.]|nr:hypothetical protein [Chryseolinea sp.]